MRVLGISCDYHDAAAAVVIDGEIAAAAEEERFSRLKHDDTLPEQAVASCLAVAGLTADDLDAVVFHEKPLAVLSRVVAARQRRGPGAIGAFSREMPVLLSRNLMIGYRVEMMLRRLGARRPRLAYGEHHLSHAAAAFYPSPYPSAAVLTIDGIGEWATASIGHGTGRHLELLAEQRYPHSLGLLYSLATTWCGFQANEGEYKLMGLAPFGEPTFTDALGEIVTIDADGGIDVDLSAVGWWDGRRRGRSHARLSALFDGPPRAAGAATTQRDADLARSIQQLTEDAVMRMAAHAHRATGSRNLCLAGGVALNCVANGKLLADGPFDSLWVQPAAGDAGSAVGAALWWYHQEHEAERTRTTGSAPPGVDGMRAGQLGPSFTAAEVHRWLADEDVPHTVVTDEADRCRQVAARLADGAVVAWFEGAMEFGPRALGHRSLLADPRSPTVQRDINLRVKGRESFRPFAPAVLWEDATDWFELTEPSPYMSRTCLVVEERRIAVDEEPEDFVARVQVPRSEIPACTHVDWSARVQTVHRETNPLFHRLLRAFRDATGCPVLLNTSFNRAGEPIVCTPEDALRSAIAAGVDLLVVEDALIDVPRLSEPVDAEAAVAAIAADAEGGPTVAHLVDGR